MVLARARAAAARLGPQIHFTCVEKILFSFSRFFSVFLGFSRLILALVSRPDANG